MAARTAQRDSALKWFRPLAPDAAIALLWRLADERNPHDAVVLDADWRRFFEAQPALARAPLFGEMAEIPAPADTPSRLLLELRAADRGERAQRLQALLRGRLAAILGTAEGGLASDEPLANLGVDSLMAIELQGQLEHELGCPIPAQTLAGSRTLVAIAEALAAAVETAAEPATP
jgi:acyl carrier protein